MKATENQTIKVTHDHLISYGCSYARRTNASGKICSGYWIEEIYLGRTTKQAFESIGMSVQDFFSAIN